MSSHTIRVAQSVGRGVLVLGLLILNSRGSAEAQTLDKALSDYVAVSWSETDGLPSNRIYAITQDLDGYLWLATDNGPVRFDGVRFVGASTLWESPPLGRRVLALCTARDGSLWFGFSGSGGIARVHHNRVTYYGDDDGVTGYVNTLIE